MWIEENTTIPSVGKYNQSKKLANSWQRFTKVDKQLAKVHKSWQTVGKSSQKLANSWQKFTKVGKQLVKVPDPVCTGATEVGNKSVSVPLLKLRYIPRRFMFLQKNLFLQLVYLADNLQ